MNRAADHQNPPKTPSRRRSTAFSCVAGFAALTLVLGACGGGDDDDGAGLDAASTTTSTVASLPPAAPTTPPTTPVETTEPPAAEVLDLVTEGATVIVANASGVDGAAGRMTDALGVVGFSTGDATNSSESQLEVTKVYYDPENADAQAVADSVKAVLGGGDIEVLELTAPAPLTDPDTLGDAGVVVAIGNDTADKTLEALQSGVAEASGEATADTSEATSEASSDG